MTLAVLDGALEELVVLEEALTMEALPLPLLVEGGIGSAARISASMSSKSPSD